MGQLVSPQSAIREQIPWLVEFVKGGVVDKGEKGLMCVCVYARFPNHWLWLGQEARKGRGKVRPRIGYCVRGFNYAPGNVYFLSFFCRCHVLFLATVTANGTRPHKGTDCEANSGLDMHVYELKLLLQEFVAPHEHILKY